ncbi:hypothetical protein MMC30_007697 [Trapelia coarctata]|nr:hypothetical protein [Trapelia coarctata]
MSNRLMDVLDAANPVFFKHSLEPGQIRLLTIHPCPDFKAKVRCSLSVHKPTDRPYKTLSYVWGEQKDQSFPTILLEGVEFKVTVNLESAMRYIRDASKDFVIWIDSICINQMNDNEKAEQVKRMSEIYEGSTETIAWLNVDECPQAAKFLQHWAKRFVEVNGGNEKQVWAGWYGGLGEKSIANLLQNIQRFDGPFSMLGPGNWEAVKSLITRPWWRRLWVFQEAVLPKSLCFQCGSMRMDEKCMEILAVLLELSRQATTPQLAQLAHHIKDCFQVDEVVFEIFKFRYEWHNFHRKDDIARFYDPLPLVSQLAHRLVTNPRDKIFAVAGLMKRNDIVHIHYKKNLGHAYASFAKDQVMFWPSFGSIWDPGNSQLRILSYAGICHIRFNPPLAAPTWVPDWRLYERKDNGHGARQMPTPLQASSYSAGGSREPEKREYGILQVIIIKGILFDRVSKTGSQVHTSPGGETPPWPPGSLSQRTLFETSRGYFGLGPAQLQTGDNVCVFFGCNVPHILRVRRGTQEHLLVGEAYVHGIMNGEVIKMVDDNKNKIRSVDIWLH